MDPCCSAGRLPMTILPKVLSKSPVVLGAPHLTDSRQPLETACGVHWMLPESFSTSLRPLCHCGGSCLVSRCGWPAGILKGWSKPCDLEWPGAEGEEACVSSGDKTGDMLLTQLSVAILLPSLCSREAAVWRQNRTALAAVLKQHLQKCQLRGSQDCAVFKKEI